MGNQLLQDLEQIASDVQLPCYVPREHGVGIVHFGFGAFHKAHQAFYTDEALASTGGDWRIVGVSLRDTRIAEQVNAQNGFFTLITQSEAGSTARIIGSVERVLSAKNHAREILDLLCAKETRIVSVTVTEKGYGIDRDSGGVDLDNPVIVDDLKNPDHPQGLLGFIVCALRRRLAEGVPAFTVVSCDNLPANGRFLRAGVLDFARRIDPECATWVADNVSFPSTMVDRITPAQTSDTLKTATKLTGVRDLAAIEAEPFGQWIIEDNFPTGRPDWPAAGVVMSDDIAPYEKMKLRMLNGSHSMLAYAGFLVGHQYVRDVARDSALNSLIKRHLASASQTLTDVPQIDLKDYANKLLHRFANPAIAHATYQIAMDGSQKMPQRIFDPAMSVIEKGFNVRPYTFATALWMRYCAGVTDEGESYELQDPIADQLELAASQAMDTEQIVDRFSDIPALIPHALSSNNTWKESLVSSLQLTMDKGVRQAIDVEAQSYHLAKE